MQGQMLAALLDWPQATFASKVVMDKAAGACACQGRDGAPAAPTNTRSNWPCCVPGAHASSCITRSDAGACSCCRTQPTPWTSAGGAVVAQVGSGSPARWMEGCRPWIAGYQPWSPQTCGSTPPGEKPRPQACRAALGWQPCAAGVLGLNPARRGSCPPATGQHDGSPPRLRSHHVGAAGMGACGACAGMPRCPIS